MPSNFYFNNFNSKGEQNLMQDLVVESIKMYGIDLFYLPKEIINLSTVFTEQQTAQYNQAVSTVMYIKSVDGFDGDGEFLSSFGVEVREEITFSAANFTFDQEVGQLVRRDRPLESDLIWFPLNKALFQIKYVNVRPVFYQFGTLQYYDITCELFEYSNEIFNTGIEAIDTVYNSLQTTTTTYQMVTESGTQLYTEEGFELLDEQYDIQNIPQNQNSEFSQLSANFLDFSNEDPFSELTARIS
jgi:Virus neck protein